VVRSAVLQIFKLNRSSNSGGTKRLLVFKMRRERDRGANRIKSTDLIDAEEAAKKAKGSLLSNTSACFNVYD
jgi:hypothetical protein